MNEFEILERLPPETAYKLGLSFCWVFTLKEEKLLYDLGLIRYSAVDRIAILTPKGKAIRQFIIYCIQYK